MIKSPHIHSRHNHFCGAIWAAVHRAGRTMKQRFFVVQEPGHRRWLVANQQFIKETRCKSVFKVSSYRTPVQRVRACGNAHKAMDAWRLSLYQKLAATGDPRWIPRRSSDHSQEILLEIAARHNNTSVMALLIRAGADVNHNAGKALWIAVLHDHQDAITTLLASRASILCTRSLLYRPQLSVTPRSWMQFLNHLIGFIKNAGLDENLPAFDELNALAREAVFRPLIEDLATRYPTLSAKLL